MAGKRVKAPSKSNDILGALKSAIGTILTQNPGAKAGSKAGNKAADLLLNMHKKKR